MVNDAFIPDNIHNVMKDTMNKMMVQMLSECHLYLNEITNGIVRLQYIMPVPDGAYIVHEVILGMALQRIMLKSLWASGWFLNIKSTTRFDELNC